MVTEIADIRVRAGAEDAFERGVGEAAPLFRRAKGCSSMALRKMEEEPGRYQLIVEWATLEDHTVTFRESDDFQKWRALVGDFFATAPVVSHWYEVSQYFG
jgi:heme-degrading monooxygenase HmoA